MVDTIKISELPALAASTENAVLPVVDGGQTRRATPAQINKTFKPWTPTVIDAPAVFTTVAGGFGSAVISNGGMTVSTESSGSAVVSSDAGSTIVSSSEVGFVFRIDPDDLNEETNIYIGFSDAAAPNAGLTCAPLLIFLDGSIAADEMGSGGNTAPVSVTYTASTEWCLTIQESGGSSTLRLYKDDAPTTPVVSWVVVDEESNPVDCSAVDRLFAYIDAETIVNLVHDPVAAFVYTPVDGGKAINPASYPENRNGNAYQLALSEPAYWAELNKIVSNGFTVRFDTVSGEPAEIGSGLSADAEETINKNWYFADGFETETGRFGRQSAALGGMRAVFEYSGESFGTTYSVSEIGFSGFVGKVISADITEADHGIPLIVHISSLDDTSSENVTTRDFIKVGYSEFGVREVSRVILVSFGDGLENGIEVIAMGTDPVAVRLRRAAESAGDARDIVTRNLIDGVLPYVADADDSSLASLKASVDALRDALITAGFMQDE